MADNSYKENPAAGQARIRSRPSKSPSRESREAHTLPLISVAGESQRVASTIKAPKAPAIQKAFNQTTPDQFPGPHAQRDDDYTQHPESQTATQNDARTGQVRDLTQDIKLIGLRNLQHGPAGPGHPRVQGSEVLKSDGAWIIRSNNTGQRHSNQLQGNQDQ